MLSGCDCYYQISGVVMDAHTKLPLSGVAISTTETPDPDHPNSQNTFSKGNGQFEVSGVAGVCDKVSLYFMHQDYIRQAVTLSNNSTDTIYLTPKANTTTFFDFRKEYQITSLSKRSDAPSSMNDTTICKDWNLSERDVRFIIGKAKEIDGSQWHYLFDHLPCRVTGKLVQNDRKYELSINSGAWLTISSSDTTLMYGSFNNTNNKYFMSTVWTEEDEGE